MRSLRPDHRPRRLALAVLTALCLCAPEAVAAVESSPLSPVAARGLTSTDEPLTPAEVAELQELEQRVREFEEKAQSYREESRRLIEARYHAKRSDVQQQYDRRIAELETEQRLIRDDAIAKFEVFLKRYPADPRFTPDAMFRLAELYFERSYDEHLVARAAYDKALEAFSRAPKGREPVEPTLHYEPTIAMMQRLITAFPDYRLADGAYYLLGYCLTEQAEEDRAVDVFEELVQKFPESRFGPEVWTRIGEHYFNTNALERALAAYSRVLGAIDSPFYDKALYKLAWTHYRMADPERAPHEFQLAVDHFVKLLEFNAKTQADGDERGGDLREESIQYIAISYADEAWGGVDKLLEYLQALGPKPYERELLRALADVYFDQTRFQDSIRVYQLVQDRYPTHPDAPAAQERIVTAYERERNFDGAAAAREQMTQRFSRGGKWYDANANAPEVLQRAEKLTENALYSAAVFHHRQAQVLVEAKKTELAIEQYGKAATAYGEYLLRFPHDRQLYELTFYYAESLYYSLQFEPAAAQYEKVRDSTADKKFLSDAAFSTVLAYERAVQAAEKQGSLTPMQMTKSTERKAGEPVVAREIPPLRGRLVGASDRFAELVPAGDQVPSVLYRAAQVYYAHDHFEEARRRFQSLLDRYPRHQVAEYAANLVIESYLTEQNFVAVEEFTRAMLAKPATAERRELKGELVKFKTGAMFKLAEDHAGRGEYEKAAELYLKMLDENPQSQFADSALNNAAVAYEKVQRFESASKLYERLVKQYPKSPLADTALFRVGLNAERFFDFEKAIATYTQLLDRYPKSELRPDALYNAALSLENTQAYERAAQLYGRYCELFPKREDAPQVCFRAGVAFEKMGSSQRVIATYQRFVEKYRNNTVHADRVIEAMLKIAKAYDKLNKDQDARRYFDGIVAAAKRNPSEKTAPYAAEAQFQLVERSFERFKAMKIQGSGKKLAASIQTKAKTLKEVETGYKLVLGFKQVDWTMAALYRIGQLYHALADSIVAAPCPDDVKRAARGSGLTVAEVCDEYRVQVEEQASIVEDKAVTAYETTINRARDLQVVNRWTQATLVALNKLRRASWPLQKPARLFVDGETVATPPVLDANGKPVMRAAPEPVAPPVAAPTPTPPPAPAVTPEAPSTPSTPAPAPAAAAAPVSEPGLAPAPPPPPALAPGGTP